MTEKEGLIRLVRLLIKTEYFEVPNILEVLEKNYERFRSKPELFTREMRRTFRMFEIIKSLEDENFERQIPHERLRLAIQTRGCKNAIGTNQQG